ncbi:MAG: enoyl-CoA hydratase-related protein [Blastocatellia bacterium]
MNDPIGPTEMIHCEPHNLFALVTVVGKSRALEMILTGDMIGAEEALRIGLINRATGSADELMVVGEKQTVNLGRNAPLAVKYALEAVNHGMEVSLGEGLSLESSLFSLCFATEDAREGIRAFLEKRSPVFKGK